jgi:hypothetical protein
MADSTIVMPGLAEMRRYLLPLHSFCIDADIGACRTDSAGVSP